LNPKVAAGLIVLTAVGTYVIAHPRRHHFEPTKFEGGAVLLDAETGVLCSGRFGLKWNDADRKAVWAAGLAARRAEKEYNSFIEEGVKAFIASQPAKHGGELPVPVPMPVEGNSCYVFSIVEEVRKCNDLFSAINCADSEYNSLVARADNEKVPDADSSHFKSLPLCKDLR
jgi:hypothetical protein